MGEPKRKRRRYDDEFRASAVLMLEAAGYPNEGSLVAVAKRLKIPESTLRSWYNAHARNSKEPSRSQPPSKVYGEKKRSIKELFETELRELIASMPDNRQDAAYRDKGWVAGVLFDKLQLLDNKPTAIIKLQEAIEQGKITKEQAAERWPALMRQYEHINA